MEEEYERIGMDYYIERKRPYCYLTQRCSQATLVNRRSTLDSSEKNGTGPHRFTSHNVRREQQTATILFLLTLNSQLTSGLRSYTTNP